VYLLEKQKEMEKEMVHKREVVADKALVSAVKIITELRRAADLQAYSRHPRIAAKFPNGTYRTGVTVGLHLGWAVEGAIGSDFKIDALHLGQDASVAYRIEELCQHYGT
jgi:class 3 adenylate cyclase